MNSLDLTTILFLALAAMAACAVNAIAGGGTLISFPALTAVGIPAVAANVTNTVALTPGYLGATWAQAADLRGQRRRLWLLVPTGVAGGVVGALLLVTTEEKLFRALVPYLILLAALLLAIQPRVRTLLERRRATHPHAAHTHDAWVILPVFVASIYGGYFGAGLSVIILAVLGLVIDDNLTRLNALKQAIAFSVNVAAASFFLFSGLVVWPAALVMMVGAIAGGVIGGRIAGRISPNALRRVIVVLGVTVALIYLLR